MKKKIDLALEYLSLLVICVAPFLYNYWIKDSYMGDFVVFEDWAKAWDQSPIEIFTNYQRSSNNFPPTINYPGLGVFFSAGIISWIKFHTHFNPWQTLRAFLSLVDVLNALLIAGLLRLVNIRRAFFFAAIISLMPATWIGGSTWMQIDGVTQLFTLASLLSFFLSIKISREDESRRSMRTCFLFYGAGLSSMLASVFVKQLALFNLPALIIAGSFASYELYIRYPKSKVFFASVVATVLAGYFVFDFLIFDLPGGYLSSLDYILFGGGSSHGDIIANNGFNMWVLIFGKDRMLTSSLAHSWLGLNPHLAGEILYLSALGFFSYEGWKSIRRVKMQKQNSNLSLNFCLILFYLAACNLAFNIFLTGTHERYLCHFYPFLFVAALGLRHLDKKLFPLPALLGIFLCGLSYAGFVYSIMLWHPAFGSSLLADHYTVGALHLLLLLYLFFSARRIFRSRAISKEQN